MFIGLYLVFFYLILDNSVEKSLFSQIIISSLNSLLSSSNKEKKNGEPVAAFAGERNILIHKGRTTYINIVKADS